MTIDRMIVSNESFLRGCDWLRWQVRLTCALPQKKTTTTNGFDWSREDFKTANRIRIAEFGLQHTIIHSEVSL
jgi:hypothetical protein